MTMKMWVRKVMMTGIVGGGLCAAMATPAYADVEELGACLHTCSVAYAGTGYTAGYNQCVSSCIILYDGGYGNGSGGNGTTPINPGVCDSGKCVRV